MLCYLLVGLTLGLALFAVHFARYLDGKPIPGFRLMDRADFTFTSFLLIISTPFVWPIVLPLLIVIGLVYWWKRGRKNGS